MVDNVMLNVFLICAAERRLKLINHGGSTKLILSLVSWSSFLFSRYIACIPCPFPHIAGDFKFRFKADGLTARLQECFS